MSTTTGTPAPATDPGTPGSRRARSRRRLWWAVGVVGAVLLAGALALFQPWLLFVDTTVDEALPGTAVAAAGSAGTGETAGAADVASSTGEDTAPVVLARGEFRSFEHPTTGTVLLVRLPDGSTVLRLEDLATDNGPDVRVWLSAQPVDRAGDAEAAGFLGLGALKGNLGNQNYAVPADADLDAYASVILWCDRFNVPFGAAQLQPV
ncbi:MAG: DM13 domain-containing protein [Candidatus Nanopelagicales bacterium]